MPWSYEIAPPTYKNFISLGFLSAHWFPMLHGFWKMAEVNQGAIQKVVKARPVIVFLVSLS